MKNTSLLNTSLLTTCLILLMHCNALFAQSQPQKLWIQYSTGTPDHDLWAEYIYADSIIHQIYYVRGLKTTKISSLITNEVVSSAPWFGVDRIASKKVEIRDCDGDDPTCEEFHDESESNGNIVTTEPNLQLDKNRTVHTVLVFDILGRGVFSGNSRQQFISQSTNTGVFIISYFDKLGDFIRSEKIALLQ